MLNIDKVLAKTIFIIWLFQQILTWLFQQLFPILYLHPPKMCKFWCLSCVLAQYYLYFRVLSPKLFIFKFRHFKWLKIVCKLVGSFYANIIYLENLCINDLIIIVIIIGNYYYYCYYMFIVIGIIVIVFVKIYLFF